ncbi:hypothetical protein CC80DRAFT_484034 [Byssothecium circinans]|uniref:Heat shock factor binding protein 1-domain-containing protein n=1 Tax=Byssothecium circinans TaxID=147558 RepID=A0A6A5TD45_9PLEO|nr:hypothetical protein CC80DRAFT_484034 [Byssothecium circinans]
MTTNRPSTDRTASEQTPNPNTDSSAELAQVVDDLLTQLNNKFSTVSSELLSKMDDMSRRLDNLEATIQGGDGKGAGSAK